MEPIPAQTETTGFPGIVMAALRGGSGKTLFSVGTIAALKKKGKKIAPFKKGPDYIDAGWLALAASRPCYNLDTFLIDPDRIVSSFRDHARQTDLAVIEGNRGLFDSIDIDPEGRTSTAELAKSLDLPLLLCLDATKTTRTMAAVVLGCRHFDPDLRLGGVLLNRVAGSRHENNLRKNIEHYCGVPVLGAVPKLGAEHFPERHMGLVPTPEHAWAAEAVARIADIAQKYLDLDAILDAAGAAAGPEAPIAHSPKPRPLSVEAPASAIEIGRGAPRIAVIQDAAFQFYYPENLEALERAGAELVYTSPLRETAFPTVDALYIGGGFPETHAPRLAANRAYRERIREQAAAGLPVYAECGGLMYLGRELLLDDGAYAMAGVLPLVFKLFERPQGHGYTVVDVTGENPFFEPGTVLKGHEFHYSRVVAIDGPDPQFAFSMLRGRGIQDCRDGICHQNVLATYTHIHAAGTPAWAVALVRCARGFQHGRR